MAKNTSIIKLQGTIGDITFVRTRHGYIAKEKTSINSKRFFTDSAFQRTRENANEFGRSNKGGKLIRTSFRPLLRNVKDVTATNRLTKEMMRVIKADASSLRGQRNVIDGEVALLNGFEFNIGAQLQLSFSVLYTSAVDRAAGTLQVNIPAFNPMIMVKAPEGATHFKLVSAGSEIDFENEQYIQSFSETGFISLTAENADAVNLVSNVTPNSTHPLFLLLGIQYFQEVNNVQYPIKDGSYNALAIIKATGE